MARLKTPAALCVSFYEHNRVLSALAALATRASFLLKVACVFFRWRREHMRERMWREVTEEKGTEK